MFVFVHLEHLDNKGKPSFSVVGIKLNVLFQNATLTFWGNGFYTPPFPSDSASFLHPSGQPFLDNLHLVLLDFHIKLLQIGHFHLFLTCHPIFVVYSLFSFSLYFFDSQSLPFPHALSSSIESLVLYSHTFSFLSLWLLLVLYAAECVPRIISSLSADLKNALFCSPLCHRANTLRSVICPANFTCCILKPLTHTDILSNASSTHFQIYSSPFF